MNKILFIRNFIFTVVCGYYKDFLSLSNLTNSSSSKCLTCFLKQRQPLISLFPQTFTH